jgi:hypothetical protein
MQCSRFISFFVAFLNHLLQIFIIGKVNYICLHLNQLRLSSGIDKIVCTTTLCSTLLNCMTLILKSDLLYFYDHLQTHLAGCNENEQFNLFP